MLSAHALSRRGTAGERLLDDVSFELQPGSRVALRGRTGSGKTLLLRSLSLIDPVAGGDVLWEGRSVADADVPGFRRRVFYASQNPTLFEGTVEDNLRVPFSLKAHPGEFDRGRALELLEPLGKDEEFLSRRQSRLSGGEAQIVALVRGLSIEPRVLLLDEPTASMDPETERAAEELVLAWLATAPERNAFLWVSHSPEQAERVSKALWEIRDGHLYRQVEAA